MADPITVSVVVPSVFATISRKLFGGGGPRVFTPEMIRQAREAKRIQEENRKRKAAAFLALFQPPKPPEKKPPSKPIPKRPPTKLPRQPAPTTKPKRTTKPRTRKPPVRARGPQRPIPGAPPVPPGGTRPPPGRGDIPKPTPRGIGRAIFGLLRVNPWVRIVAEVIIGVVIPAIRREEQRAERARETIRIKKRQKAEEELAKTKERLRKQAAERAGRIELPRPAPAPAAEPAPRRAREKVEIRPPAPATVTDPVQVILRQRARERQKQQIRTKTTTRTRTPARTRPALRVPPLIPIFSRSSPGIAPTRIRERVPQPDTPRVPIDTFQPTIGSITPGQPQTRGFRDKKGRCVCKPGRTRKKRKKARVRCKEGFFREKMWGGEDFIVWRTVPCEPELPPLR